MVRRLLPLLLLAGLTASGCALPAEPVAAPAPAGTRAPVATGSALEVLAGLPVQGRAPRTGYDRELFGPSWADVDRNGCDTRNDVLARDLVDDEVRPGTRGCVVVAGTLADPYSGEVVAFAKERASEVQVDHVVALSHAWQTGAQGWDAGTRQRFANDPLNLLAVRGDLNQSKGDGDAATWLPPARGYRCAYVARQVAVKAGYGLWVTPPERDAVMRVLEGCPGQPVPAA